MYGSILQIYRNVNMLMSSLRGLVRMKTMKHPIPLQVVLLRQDYRKALRIVCIDKVAGTWKVGNG